MKRFILLSISWICVCTAMMAQSVAYADQSVLATGHWAKIRIPQTGIYELTDSLLALAGMEKSSEVRIYGYGGAWQPEVLSNAYLQKTDDLKEVPLCVTPDGRRLFFGVGPVNWTSPISNVRMRNPYSDAGYYFLTDSKGTPQVLDSTAFVKQYYPHPNDYHALYEVDNYCWFKGGRQMFDERLFGPGKERQYTLPAYSASGQLYVRMSYDNYFDAEVYVNDSLVGHLLVNATTTGAPQRKAFPDKYSCATVDGWSFSIPTRLQAVNTITIRQLSGANIRLDYLSLQSKTPRQLPAFSQGCAVPEYVGAVANQDLHGDAAADMVIIIPANKVLLQEAERLAAMHREMDSLRVKVVTADALYNEYSSGTPDANAYRRYLKMLYDRAERDADKPRYLLLMGDGAWDNRLLTSDWRRGSLTADDLLLCYESENSFSTTQCFVSDDFFCMLDEGEGANMQYQDIGDVAVGRLPARTSAQAKVMVDKIIRYRKDENPGFWQNTIYVMGDDGDNNRHMRDAEIVADSVMKCFPAYYIKKVYWDAYQMQVTSVGNRYPEVTKMIKDQMRQGALVMNYTGHGAAKDLSHEFVLTINDFKETTTNCLPLWVTASCDIMPYDSNDENIGEAAMLNPNGGAIAFFGTVRTVYANKNMPINRSFMHYVLGQKDGRRITIGEAVRMAKTDMIELQLDLAENKLQYGLLGDPALALRSPVASLVIDSINGQPVTAGLQQLKAGEVSTVSGHIPGHDDFRGVATLSVQDAREHVVCRMNATDTDTPFEFDHWPSTVFAGSDSVVGGRFRFTFPVPLDISYADGVGQMLVHAVSNDRTLSAHGLNHDFTLGSGSTTIEDNDGPAISCYLDYTSFVDGGKTSSSPFFYAQLNDDDGINVSGNGIGHDMQLIIDGSLVRTYTLNDYFIYAFGDYRQGEVGYTIPHLPDGPHQLQFRAWDMLNHSSTVTLHFEVEAGFQPSGIQGIVNDEWFSRRREQMQGDVYDASGRFVGHEIPQRLGLYIFKSKRGQVKKIMVKGNK